MQVLFADLYTPYIPIPEGRGFTALFGNTKIELTLNPGTLPDDPVVEEYKKLDN